MTTPTAGAPGFLLFETAIGLCGLAWSGEALTAVRLPGSDAGRMRARLAAVAQGDGPASPPPWVERAVGRIQGLLRGEVDDLLDLPLDMGRVPPFHQRVYAVARAIPPGRTLTYGEVAEQLGERGAARAVGQALGANPFAPVVPCHRVLAAGQRPGGFSAPGGLRTKLRLLEIERAQLGGHPGLF